MFETKIIWDNIYNEPTNYNWAQILYKIRSDDAKQNLFLDKLEFADLVDYYADNIASFDALVVQNNKLEKKMALLQRVMNTATKTLQVLSSQRTEPFKKNGVTNIANYFELSDGQTITIFFHNPDSTPNKIKPTDEIISYKWLLNKKDITIVVAPEKGTDLNVREVAKRIMKLAEKNSAAFERANQRRAEKAQKIKDTENEIAELEAQLESLKNELEHAIMIRDNKKNQLEQINSTFRDNDVETAQIMSLADTLPIDIQEAVNTAYSMSEYSKKTIADLNNKIDNLQQDIQQEKVYSKRIAKENERKIYQQSLTEKQLQSEYLDKLQSAIENNHKFFMKNGFTDSDLIDLTKYYDASVINRDVISLLEKIANKEPVKISKDEFLETFSTYWENSIVGDNFNADNFNKEVEYLMQEVEKNNEVKKDIINHATDANSIRLELIKVGSGYGKVNAELIGSANASPLEIKQKVESGEYKKMITDARNEIKQFIKNNIDAFQNVNDCPIIKEVCDEFNITPIADTIADRKEQIGALLDTIKNKLSTQTNVIKAAQKGSYKNFVEVCNRELEHLWAIIYPQIDPTKTVALDLIKKFINDASFTEKTLSPYYKEIHENLKQQNNGNVKNNMGNNNQNPAENNTNNQTSTSPTNLLGNEMSDDELKAFQEKHKKKKEKFFNDLEEQCKKFDDEITNNQGTDFQQKFRDWQDKIQKEHFKAISKQYFNVDKLSDEEVETIKNSGNYHKLNYRVPHLVKANLYIDLQKRLDLYISDEIYADKKKKEYNPVKYKRLLENFINCVENNIALNGFDEFFNPREKYITETEGNFEYFLMKIEECRVEFEKAHPEMSPIPPFEKMELGERFKNSKNKE